MTSKLNKFRSQALTYNKHFFRVYIYIVCFSLTGLPIILGVILLFSIPSPASYSLSIDEFSQKESAFLYFIMGTFFSSLCFLYIKYIKPKIGPKFDNYVPQEGKAEDWM